MARRPAVDTHHVMVEAFGLADELDAGTVTPWHSHGHHQLLYAAAGLQHLEAAGGQWLLPPQRAALIPPQTLHRVWVRRATSLRTVYFAPGMLREAPADITVFPVDALAREMVLYAMRWGPGCGALDALAEAFLRSLALLTVQWATGAVPLKLPAARSPALRRAMAHALENLGGGADLEAAARAAGVSPRTLNRRFQSEAGTTWREFVHHARMTRAMELLADPSFNTTQAALEVGFASPGAFTRAFAAFAGELPSRYRRRAQGGPRD